MADGEGEGVGNIVGFGRFAQVEEEADHLLHLFFFGATITGDGFFDFCGGIFGDIQIMATGRHQGDATDLTQRHSRFEVDAVEDFLQ